MEKNLQTKDVKPAFASKGHKISAALYLVTNHVSDTDPLKQALRTHAVRLATLTDQTATVAEEILSLLEIAVLAGLVTRQNALLISQELLAYRAIQSTHNSALVDLFTSDTTQTSSIGRVGVSTNMSFSTKSSYQTTPKNNINNEQKNKRQSEILSFINQRKSAVIKDIAGLFPNVSEKTIQRELGALVDAGKITKRGSKRWSIYLAVS